MVADLSFLEKRFELAPPKNFRGDISLVIPADKNFEILRILRDDNSYLFNLLSDLTAVDYSDQKPRFEVIYQLYSLSHNHRLRIRTPLEEDALEIQSVCKIWKTADWYEREVFDMFGIRFSGHPNLKRILMPESFIGHPLRKDFKAEERQKIPVPIERP
jgi:NADH-quinone oxidoreductase subunit C